MLVFNLILQQCLLHFKIRSIFKSEMSERKKNQLIRIIIVVII